MTTPRQRFPHIAPLCVLVGLTMLELPFAPPLVAQSPAPSPALFDAPLLHDAQEELALLGDVDHDGDVDAIGFVSVGGTLIKTQARVFWNDGVGNLAAGPVLMLPTDVGNQVAYADVDGDGRGDLLVTNSFVAGTPGLRVFPGLPGGLFAAPVFLPLPGNPIGLRTGDANGDGLADLCVLCGAGNGWQLRWYAGDPARVFPLGTPLNLSLDYRPAMVVLDADGDGDRDAAMLNVSQNRLEIVFSNGLVPSAGPVVPFAAGSVADLVAIDVDGDGDDDLVTHSSDFGSATLLPLLQQPGGTWVAGALQPVGTADAGGMFAADWDGDGDQDLLLRGYTGSGITPSHSLVWLRNQAGTFVAARTETVFAFGDTSNGAGVADLDADGDRDFVDTRALRFNHPRLLTAPLAGPNTLLRDWDDDGDLDARIESTKSLAKNDGSGLFSTQAGFWPSAAPGTTFGTPIAVADFDGDGLQEALAPRIQLSFPGQFLGVHRLEADGDDRLVDQGIACATALNFGLPLDVDGDGDLDLVTSQGLVVQQPIGTFTLQSQAFAGLQPHAVADLDGDGDEDVLLADGTLSLAVLWRTAPATYTLDVVLPASGNTVIPVYVAVADLDDDGDLDFAAARHAQFFSTQKQVELWTNQAGVFTLAQTMAIDGRPLAGDVDDDGTTDLVVLTSNAAHVRRRVGPGLTYAPESRFSQFGCFALADLEQDGDLDLFGVPRVANLRFVGAAAGSRQQYGIGGLGTDGRRPLLSAVGAIRPGLTCDLRLRRALGGMPVALFFGASAIDIPNLLPGVTGYVGDLFASVLLGLGGPAGVPGAGTLDLPLALPPTAALLDVYVHALVLDPTGPIGLVHSNAIVLRIGL